MSANPTPIDLGVSSSSSSSKLQNGQLRLTGRVENTRVHEGRRRTVVTLPAADEFERPTPVEVASEMNQHVGSVGEVATFVAKLESSSRPFNPPDGSAPIRFYSHYLRLVAE